MVREINDRMDSQVGSQATRVSTVHPVGPSVPLRRY